MRARAGLVFGLVIASSGCALVLGLEDDYRDDRGVVGGPDATSTDAPDIESAAPGQDAAPTVDAGDGGDAADANADGSTDGGLATSIANVTGLAAWFSGDVGVDTNGATVTSWTSHGGAAVVATPIAGAVAPYRTQAINGLPTVHLDGAPNKSTPCPCPGFGASLATSLGQPLTIVAVFKNARWTDNTSHFHGILLANSIAPPGYIKLHGTVLPGPAPTWALTGTATITTNPFDDPGFKAAHVIGAKIDGASSLIRIDGVERATGGIGNAPWGTGITIGNEGSPLSTFQGDIAELAIFERGLDATEMGAVEGAFKAKYATP